MRLFVPAVGHQIKLTSDWTFDLYYEHRNNKLLEIIDAEYAKVPDGWGRWTYGRDDESRALKHTSMTLPAGTVLEVDRVYIRAQNKQAKTKDEDYDSLTFRIVEHPTFKRSIRFWAKLADVNTVECQPPDDLTKKTVAKSKPNVAKRLVRELELQLMRTPPTVPTLPQAIALKSLADEYIRRFKPKGIGKPTSWDWEWQNVMRRQLLNGFLRYHSTKKNESFTTRRWTGTQEVSDTWMEIDTTPDDLQVTEIRTGFDAVHTP